MASLSECMSALQGHPALKRVLNSLFSSMVSAAPSALTAATPAAITSLAPPAGGVGAAAGGWDTAGNRDLAIASITAIRTDLAATRTQVAALVVDITALRATLATVTGITA